MRANPSGGARIQSTIYTITRGGFTLLAMGFTGKKALAFKLAYIDVFGATGSHVQNQREGPGSPPCQFDLRQLISPPIGRWRGTVATKFTAATIAGPTPPEPRRAVRDAAAARGPSTAMGVSAVSQCGPVKGS